MLALVLGLVLQRAVLRLRLTVWAVALAVRPTLGLVTTTPATLEGRGAR
jgi:hypothetical protein